MGLEAAFKSRSKSSVVLTVGRTGFEALLELRFKRFMNGMRCPVLVLTMEPLPQHWSVKQPQCSKRCTVAVEHPG